ncbi:nucleolin isoform X1 [Fundulus heteroclitus]|uniref:nucleolin isoform X1 n=1 Tax=Fundulus heteroclitus TaxID=8078 RepID=UPI00165C13E1|nr:nucleolin isoform X1 [Fundulus heteroclitus]
MVKLAKAANKQAQKKKAPPPKQVEEEEDSSEEDSSEEEETPPPKVAKKAAPAKKAKPAVKNGVTAKKAESDEEEEDDESEESSEEEAPPPKKTPAKTAPAKVKTPAKPTPSKAAAARAEESDEDDDDDDDDEDDESEEEAPPPKKAAKPAAKQAAKAAKGPAKPPAKAQPAEESSDDDEEESEEEAPPPKKAAPAKPAGKGAAKAAAKESSDDDDEEEDDDDDDEEEEAPPPKKTPPAKKSAKPAAKAQPAEESSEEEEDDSEEEMDTTPAPAATKAKKAGMVKAKEESEEDDDDDEEEDDDDDDEEEEAPVKPAKRKAEAKKEAPSAKKAKTDGEAFSLFVGNLNSAKDYEEIKELLNTFFTKNNCEVTDVRLGMSKKFGYVDFASEEDLNKALELNGKKIMGQEMRLQKAHKKGEAQDDKKERSARTLFVKNLPFSAAAEDLKEIFESAVDIRLPPGTNGQNRGIAYIEFKDEAEAEKMMEEAQGAEFQGRSIVVDYVGEKSQKGGRTPASAASSKTLVVNNLSFNATEDALQATFEKAVSIRIPQRDGRPKGFAFVEFESADDAKDALENLNHTEIEGRSIRLEFSQNSGGRDGGRGNSGPTKTLFIKGLSEDTTDQTLKDSFDSAVAARIVTDRDTGASKCFGFVDFDNENDCKAAKEAMEDGEIDGSKVTLDYAKPKGEGGFRGGRGGFGGGFGGGRGGGFRGGRGGFGGRGGGGRGGRGGRGGGRGGFGGGRGGGGGGFGGRPQGKKIKFDD